MSNGFGEMRREATITSMIPADHPLKSVVEAVLVDELAKADRDWTATVLPFPGTNGWMIRLERVAEYQLRALAMDPTTFDEGRFRERVKSLLSSVGR